MGNSRSSTRTPPGGQRSAASHGQFQNRPTNSQMFNSMPQNGSGAGSSYFQQQQQPSPVRCPACRRMLQPPAGHSRFLCPCGQMLMAPQRPQQQPPPTQPVQCPNCRTTLIPPPGAPIFRCPCGTHLRAPNLGNRATSEARLDPAGDSAPSQQSGRSGSGAPDFDTEMQDISDNVVANTLHRRADNQWLRELQLDKGVLIWRNLQSDEEERRKLMLEEKCMNELKENIKSLSEDEICSKLDNLEINTDDCSTKLDLQEKLEHSPEILMKYTSVKDLRRLLEKFGASCDALEKRELVQRLITAVWHEGLYEDGYVRQVREDHSLAWIPASKSLMDTHKSIRPVPPEEIIHVSSQPFESKLKWFRKHLAEMRIKWEDGRVQIKVRRKDLLRDSFNNFNDLQERDMHRYFRFEFIGEEGIDAGGLAREWFQLVTDQCFNVDFGLFEYSGVDNICYQINPSSGIANELHLKYFYFLGRVMGKALFDGHVIAAHMTRPLYKHLLGFPITQDDIEFVDAQVHKSMKDIRECDDVEYLYLDFTTAVRVFGETQTVDLKANGANIEVTNQNREDYLHLLVKYILFERISKQLAMLLHGFYEVIPENLLAVFDYQELELLLCGLPNINVDDWKANSSYRGVYSSSGASHQVVAWFWEVMAEFSEEQKARFLQFATGTSRVPVQGFSALQGNDGNIKLFTIDSVKFEISVFPKAHTCFNRIELPLYPSKALLRKYILQALQLESVGFNQE